jgi:hypothetical protein
VSEEGLGFGVEESRAGEDTRKPLDGRLVVSILPLLPHVHADSIVSMISSFFPLNSQSLSLVTFIVRGYGNTVVHTHARAHTRTDMPSVTTLTQMHALTHTLVHACVTQSHSSARLSVSLAHRQPPTRWAGGESG